MSDFDTSKMTPEVLPTDAPVYGANLKNLKELQVGAGDQVLMIKFPEGIWLGAANFADAPFSVDLEGNVTVGTLTLTNSTIKAGQTAFNTGTGYWIGTDSGTPKFSIGDGSTKYLTWDGSALTLRGSLNADDLTAGTITGRTIRTAVPAGGVGSSVVITGGTNEMIHFYYDASERATIKGYTTEGSEVTYLAIEAASGRNIKFKDSFISINGNLNPSSDEGYSLGTTGTKWDEIVGNRILQESSGGGAANVYDFAYIEMGLVPESVIRKWRTAKDGTYGVTRVDGRPDRDDVRLNFKQGTVLKWTSRGLRESESETDFAIAIASDRGMPIVLGAEPVRVIGKAKIGDEIYASEKKGLARAAKRAPHGVEVIGRCLENKITNKEKLIKVMIKF